VRGALLFLKPSTDLETVRSCISLNRILLFGQGDSSFSLSGCRHPGIRKECAHGVNYFFKETFDLSFIVEEDGELSTAPSGNVEDFSFCISQAISR
jgi:hypothetical protein